MGTWWMTFFMNDSRVGRVQLCCEEHVCVCVCVGVCVGGAGQGSCASLQHWVHSPSLLLRWESGQELFFKGSIQSALRVKDQTPEIKMWSTHPCSGDNKIIFSSLLFICASDSCVYSNLWTHLFDTFLSSLLNELSSVGKKLESNSVFPLSLSNTLSNLILSSSVKHGPSVL